MRILILLLAAAATIGAAPPRRVAPYEAGGFEPNWVLRVDRGRLTYETGTPEPTLNMAVPRRRPVRNGYQYVTPRLTVDVRHTVCQSYAGRDFADTVNVTFDGQFHDGCGGIGVAPRALADTWWYILSIGGTVLDDPTDDYRIGFREGRMTGRAGCNEFTSFYRERRPVLALGRMAVTRTTCPAARLALEQRALAILRGPLRITWVDGDTMVLTGPGGSMRLLQ
ncbi:MAG TPA: META domain-containing protein [Allosphingosinicella sp.]